ncbi:sialate O-acetylesterase [Alistipes sp.]|uniref:sialate O-acetylesterase n=1 Tax=Alistipes sp. TaxID=1872444 RepID=UPI003AF0F0B3
MRRILLLLSVLAGTLRTAAQTDTVYVPYSARYTPPVECTGDDGRCVRLEPRRMRRDTLLRGGVCFVRLPRLVLFLCIGQSNMAGRGRLDSAARGTLPEVFLLNDAGRFERAAEPLNRYSTIRKELGMQGVGPAGSFAASYAARTGAPVGLVVNARGDTSIERWLPGAEAGYYDQALRRIRAALAWGDVAGVLWHQGEADVRHPERYEARFRTLVERLRADIGDPALPVVFGEIARWNWTGRAEGTEPFNTMLRAVAIPQAVCVSSEGLEPLRDESDPHFSAASQRELGRRYAEAMLRLLHQDKH